MKKLPDRESLLKQYKSIIDLYMGNKKCKNPRSDTLAFMAGIYGCSVKELKNIMFNWERFWCTINTDQKI